MDNTSETSFNTGTSLQANQRSLENTNGYKWVAFFQLTMEKMDV